MKKRVDWFIYSGVFILSFLIALGIHYSLRENDKKSLLLLANAIKTSAWDFDFIEMEQYLQLVALNQRYSNITYYDLISKEDKVSVDGPALNRLDGIFYKIGILKLKTIKQNIVWDSEIIGFIEILVLNRSFYIYLSIFLIQVLCQFIAYLLISLVKSREFLEFRVKARTFDLEKEVRHRQKAENNLQLILDSITDGVITTNNKGSILRMNPTAQSLLSVEMEKVRGQYVYDVFSLLDDSTEDIVECPVKSVMANKDTSGKLHLRILVLNNGSKKNVTESCTLLKSQDETITGTVLVLRDVTDILKMQSSLEHHQRMDAIGTLAGGIAHDFNNMLGGIQGASELLQTYISGNEQALTMNEMVLETCKRATGLTRKLLTFSRKQSVVFSAFDLNDILEFSTAILERTIDRKILIRMNLNAERSIIDGDATMMESVFINLGINASHAMPSGGILIFETKNSILDENYCRESSFDLAAGHFLDITIRDTGCGIPKHTLLHIFEPFYTTKTEAKGTGLGLSTVYGTIKQHKGEVQVQSELNKGTEFLLRLPLSTLNDDDNREIKKSEKLLIKENHGTILVADDEEIIRHTLERMLESLGYSVISVQNGQEALDAFSREERVDLILLDMLMPVLNGHETYSKIREISRDIPVIISSGFSNPEDVQDMIKQGHCYFIQKPFRSSELNTLLQKALNSE